jgi:hypothetical protein
MHRDLACESCHASDTRHGETLVRTARDCAACHHDENRVFVACQGCHVEKELAGTARVAVTKPTSVAATPHTRELPFEHRTHRDVDCKSCHTTPVTLAPSRDCTGCHEQHHDAKNDCMTCHQPATVTTAKHTRDVHLGCSGSGCHVDAAAQALPASRSVCLVCHQDQTKHKPGRECADCHRTGWNAGTRSAQ